MSTKAKPRFCRECNVRLPNLRRGGRQWCESCALQRQRQSQREWNHRNKGDAWLRHRYGITEVEYLAMLATQGGGCAICGSTLSFAGRRLPVDHDHDTGEVRGILCDHCNRGLGSFGDDSDRLRLAAAYLDRCKQVNTSG